MVGMRICCPNCNREFNVPESAGGKRATCKCGTKLRVPSPKQATPPNIPPEPETNPLQPGAKKQVIAFCSLFLSYLLLHVDGIQEAWRQPGAKKQVIAFCSLSLSFLLLQVDAFQEAWGPKALSNYVAIVLFMVSVAIWTSFRFRWSWIAASLIGVVWLYYYGRSDYYLEVWQSSTNSKHVYQDKYWRWGNRNMRRRFITFESTDEATEAVDHAKRHIGNVYGLEQDVVSGELTESGKMHGKWTTKIHDPSNRYRILGESYEWYWYGEKVSEGEFVLRSK